MGAFREQWLKPALYLLLVVVGMLIVIVAVRALPGAGGRPRAWRWLPVAGLVALILVLATPGLLSYMTVDRFRMDANHFWVAFAVIAVSVWAASHARPRLQRVLYTLIATTSTCGVLMLLRFGWLETVNRFAYTAFDAGLTLLAAAAALALATRPVES